MTPGESYGRFYGLILSSKKGRYMYAVIMTGGRQYRVKDGDILSVEKIEGEPGQHVEFDRILLIEDGKTVLVGTPALEGAVVRAEILETYKDDKIVVFKKKRRKQFKRTRGHRQLLTRIRVDGIAAERGALPALRPRPKKAAPVEEKPRMVKPGAAAKPEPAKKARPAEKAGKRVARAAPAKAGKAKKKPAKARTKPRKAGKE